MITRAFERVRLLVRSSHPGPTAAVTVLSALLATALGYSTARILVIAVAILLGQLSIGLSNDWLDARRDSSVGRTDKPVAQGLLSVSTVRRAALSTLVVALAVSIALGRAAFLCHALFLASAWAYNLGLKRSRVSVIPFIVGFGALPAIVTFAGAEGSPPALWAVAVGAVFGVSIHFTIVLPDLDDDARTDVAGLPQLLGGRVSGIVAFVALVVAALLVFFGPPVEHPGTPFGVVAGIGLLVAVVIAAVGIRLVITRPPSRLLFRLVIVASLVIAVELVVGGTRL